MKIKKLTSVYITPDAGQTVYEVSKEIAEAIKVGEIEGDKFFFNLPNERCISIEGKTTEEIRNSISTQWEGAKF